MPSTACENGTISATVCACSENMRLVGIALVEHIYIPGFTEETHDVAADADEEFKDPDETFIHGTLLRKRRYRMQHSH